MHCTLMLLTTMPVGWTDRIIALPFSPEVMSCWASSRLALDGPRAPLFFSETSTTTTTTTEITIGRMTNMRADTSHIP